MKTPDQEIQFNGEGWQSVMETQSKLFAPHALEAISDRLREEFYNGHAEGRQMPVIEQDDWRTDLLARYNDREIGYDLPCLLSANRPTRGRIMLCAQDPLRRGTTPSLTVGTFFGIDNRSYRENRKQHGAVWNLIRSCVGAGYDVLVTDVLKIFVGKNQLKKDPELRDLCYDILCDEISAFSPDTILAMGGEASHALSRVRAEGTFIRAIHPSVRDRGWYLEDSASPYIPRLEGIEQYYCRLLFGANSAPKAVSA